MKSTIRQLRNTRLINLPYDHSQFDFKIDVFIHFFNKLFTLQWEKWYQFSQGKWKR